MCKVKSTNYWTTREFPIYIHIYLMFFSIKVYLRRWNIVPCEIQEDPAVPPFTYNGLCPLTHTPSSPPAPTSWQPQGCSMSVSLSVSQMRSSASCCRFHVSPVM